MALMAGSSKGHGPSNSSGNRGRGYGLLLLLAFGAAVLGFMLLHKFRERRVFDLILKDKDRELLSLNLLLQKERITTKEVKRKMEEMKAKMYSLRTQKAELNNKIVDMRSMTASLKQEHMALESTLEKMQNENRILRETNTSSAKENPEIIALRELLKQKEAEIEEMKHRLEKPAIIWSVSADDPSNPPVNLTTTETTVGEAKYEVGKSKVENVAAEYQQLQESMNVKDGQNSTTRHEAENGTAIEGRNQTVTPREEQLQMWDNNPVVENTTQRGASMQDSTQRGDNGENNADEHQGEGKIEGDGQSVKPEVFQENRDPEGRNQSNWNQGNMGDNSHHGELLKTSDAEVIDEGHGAIRDGELQKPKNPQDGDGQELGLSSKGEMKLEVQHDVSQIDATSRRRGRSRSKKGHRRLRMTSRERELEKRNSEEALGDEHEQENEVMREGKGDGNSEMHDTTNTQYQADLEGGEGAVVEMGLNGKHGLGLSSDGELQKPYDPQNDEDSESTDTANGIKKELETSHLKPEDSEDGGEGLTVDSIKSKASQLADDAIEQKLDVERQQEDQEATVDRGTNEKGEGKDSNINDEAETMEVDSTGEQTGRTTETEDDTPGVLDLELDDIEGDEHESNTEEEF